MSRRTRILLIAGGAVVLVVALVAGLLVATNVATQAAADERRAAETAATEARDALDDAVDRISTAATSLEAAIAATDASLALTGAGLDDAARPALQEARDAAADVHETEGDTVGEYGDRIVARPGDDSATASAFRRQAELYADDTKLATAQAERLEQAYDALTSAVGAYLTAAQAAGAALLTDRADAADEVKAALQTQLDALPDAEPSALADTLTAYRAAVDAVVASSDAARVPATPGGSGIRVPDPASLTAVVNKRRGLPADYVPAGLVTPSGIPGATQVRSELIAPLEQLRADMAAAGITLRMSSAYRSYARQQTIYNGFVAREGVAGADTHSARPGNSEHQTGLVVDLDDGTGCNLSACFGTRPGGIWLAENAWKYGFILRYGKGWQPIVGYTYEPWHFRYVGVDVSTDMHNRGILTLEEYFGLPAAPDYG
jgi:D-alanyl-D-alanine carboxypeptidase